MRAARALFACCALILIAACSDDDAFAPSPGSEPAPDFLGPAANIAVMTRNLYVGADVDAVIGALVTSDPQDDIPALLAAVATLGRTDWPARAVAIADEIARTRPHVVGLQEVSTLDLELAPLEIDIHLDFLPVLLAALGARGLDYQAVARVRNIEATPLPGVRLLDEDVLLVDARRVQVLTTTARRFTANLGEVAPGVVLERGWVSAAVLILGRAYTIASTHLESGAAPGLDQLRAAQIGELVQTLAGTDVAIIMGDLNDVPGSPMYQVLAGAGYADVWDALRPGVTGYTCCHLPDLSNGIERFDQRIDYVFARVIDSGTGRLLGQVRRVGEVSGDRVAGPEHPIWPSDHAGLVASLSPSEAAAVTKE